MKKSNMKKIWHDYVRYLIPTVIGMITYSLYCLADVLFVSWGVGKEGLAALNIALPAFTIYSSLAICIGVGASVTINVCKGEGQSHKADQVFTLAVTLLAVLGIVLGGISIVFEEQLCRLLGADDNILEKVMVYLKPLVYTVVIYMSAGALTVMVRGDGNPRLVMAAGMIGNILNIILDYIFVMIWDMGIFGAGLATAIGFGTSAALLCLHFLCRKNTVHFTWDFKDVRLAGRMLKNGVGASVLELSVGISIFMINLSLMKYSGSTGVAIFNVISNIAFIAKGLFGGMAQASQPIISVNYGLKNTDNIRLVKKYAMLTAGITGVVAFAGLTFYSKPLIGALVSREPEVVREGSRAIAIYFTGCMFTGLNTVLMYYFQSIESAMYAILLAFVRGIALVFVLLLFLPKLAGVTGIWLVMPLAELIAFSCFIVVNRCIVRKRLISRVS